MRHSCPHCAARLFAPREPDGGPRAGMARHRHKASGNGSCARVADVREKLPAAGRRALAGLIGPQLAKLESLAKQVMNLPGVGPVLTPVLMPILARISALLHPMSPRARPCGEA
jgi:hypothetical protein